MTAKDKIKVDCKNNECDFGEPIQVSFQVDNDEAHDGENDWIGIFAAKEKNLHGGTTELWTHTCGFQWEHRPFLCPNLKSGTVTFDGMDPKVDGYNQLWPLSRGKYKVCHLNYGDELLQKCKKFEVTLSRDTKSKIKRKAMIEPTKKVYDYGEDIVADFDVGVEFLNTRVSIMRHPNNGDQQNYVNWVYTGCNNQDGDQRWSYDLSDNCLKTQRSGKVTFTTDNTASPSDSNSVVLEGGKYEMRILYNNDWQQGPNADTEIIKDRLATFKVNPQPKSLKSPSLKSPSSKSSSLKLPTLE